ncbi:MAG: Zn-dependent hydrolase [Bacteroidetes bacterium]|nr:Zn-dependent hydrolase [Bacteroidota bacterium]MCY4206141.1 Zn-dependent hydrolase [Bacteroidota bacterium]
MTISEPLLHINETRFREDFERLTRDGATKDGGLNRPALSEAHLSARETFRNMICERGFEIHEDGAGNLSARNFSPEHAQPVILLGSHLDSVADGGRFDGTLGIASAFEVIQILRVHYPQASMEVIDFTDEEGTWISLLGSRAASGQLTLQDLNNPRGNPEAFQKALKRADLTNEGILSATRHSKTLRAYLELHIEQGTRLEQSKTDIGIVTGMVGIYMYLVTFRGQSNHAGTTPMNERQDAALGASEFCLRVQKTVSEKYPDCVATVGHMDFSPGAFNIIAGRVTVFMELRSENPQRAEMLQEDLHQKAQSAANTFGLELDFQFLEAVPAQKMDPSIINIFESSSEKLGITFKHLPSLAGHDAQSMSLLSPSGLIFVPSVGGYSHSSREFTPWEACVKGANVLLNTAKRLAASLS